MNAKFDALEKLKVNNWQEEEKKAKKVIRKTKAKVLSEKGLNHFGINVVLTYRPSRSVNVTGKIQTVCVVNSKPHTLMNSSSCPP